MDKLDAILKAHVAQGDETVDKVLGVSFAVVSKDGLIYSGSAGRSRMDPSSRPFQQDTFTWIASATKIMTTTCVMHLVEQGKIGLDDDVRPLVPELAAMQVLRGFDGEKPILEDITTPITLRILLTHTLGLPYDVGDPEILKWSQSVGRTDWAMSWNHNGFNTPTKFAPGEGWLYGPALDWAGFVLEAVTGSTLGAYMQSLIFDPLSMTDTGFWPERLSADISDRAVEPVERSQETGKLEGRSPWPPAEHESESGGAGLYSTPQDYAKFLKAFLNGELLSEKSMSEIFTPQLNDKQRAAMETLAYGDAHLGFAPEFPKGQPINHGLAGVINTTDVPGKRQAGSIEWSGMVNSRWWVDRKTGIAAILFAHLMPFGDPVIARIYDQLETVVYEIVGQKA